MRIENNIPFWCSRKKKTVSDRDCIKGEQICENCPNKMRSKEHPIDSYDDEDKNQDDITEDYERD